MQSQDMQSLKCILRVLYTTKLRIQYIFGIFFQGYIKPLSRLTEKVNYEEEKLVEIVYLKWKNECCK
jgi:hypothetical protein